MVASQGGYCEDLRQGLCTSQSPFWVHAPHQQPLLCRELASQKETSQDLPSYVSSTCFPIGSKVENQTLSSFGWLEEKSETVAVTVCTRFLSLAVLLMTMKSKAGKERGRNVTFLPRGTCSSVEDTRSGVGSSFYSYERIPQ